MSDAVDITVYRLNQLEAKVKMFGDMLSEIARTVDEIKMEVNLALERLTDLNARFDFEVGRVIDVDPSTGDLEHD